MRYAVFALAIFAMAGPAMAQQQQQEMDAAESELRSAMPAGVAVDRVAPDEVRVRMPSDITFDFNSADVRGQFMPRVADLARTLVRHPGMVVHVTGHADAIGSDQYNQRLSERRAESVGLALRDYGVSFARIETSGMGEFEPIASNASEWGRAQNRRVEISIKSEKD
jgi:outer membrane protein OmpA-like peptidoglycan-associated protein